MGLWGKILLFFNLILAVVVLLLSGMDYGKRQTWRYAALKHEMVRTGLPVNSDEIREKDPTEPVIHDLGDGLLKEVFEKSAGGQDLGGAPVKTVLDELERVKAKLKQNITTSPQPKQVAKNYLVPLARTIAERQGLMSMIDGETDASLPQTQAEIDRRFKAALANGNSGPTSRKDIRSNAGTILVNLSYAADWRQRCMTVLGMDAYIDAVGRQADSLNQMAVDVEKAIATDKSTFEREYQALVQTILQESDELFKSTQNLADLQKTAEERTTQVNLRKTEKAEDESKLAQARTDADDAVKKLKEIQADLFQFQQKMGLAIEKNNQLEAELRKLELKR